MGHHRNRVEAEKCRRSQNTSVVISYDLSLSVLFQSYRAAFGYRDVYPHRMRYLFNVIVPLCSSPVAT